MIEKTPGACKTVNFLMVSSQITYGMGYDYCSILHYSEGQGVASGCEIKPLRQFSCHINGKVITKIGQRVGLSETDIKEINFKVLIHVPFSVLSSTFHARLKKK